jgi:hypothetical protein
VFAIVQSGASRKSVSRHPDDVPAVEATDLDHGAESS